MVSEPRKQSIAWIEMHRSLKTYALQWKRKWRLEHLGALGIMGETAPLTSPQRRNIILTASNNT